MKKIVKAIIAIAAVTVLAGCQSSGPTKSFGGVSNGCHVEGTEMTDTYRIYNVTCPYKQDVNLYTRNPSCRVTQDLFRVIHFPDHKAYKILCRGPNKWKEHWD